MESAWRGPERQSNPAERLIRILELMAEHPTERFTVTRLAAALDISKATCLGIVNSLARNGYLIRNDGEKTYTLGFGLLRLGVAASKSFGMLDVAVAHLAKVQQELGMPCTVCGRVGTEVVVLAHLPGDDDTTVSGPRALPCGGGVATIPGRVQVGETFPLFMATGLSYAAWFDEEQFERWIARAAGNPGHGDVLRAQAASARVNGYLVGRLVGMWSISADLLSGLESPDAPLEAVRAVQALIAEMDRYYDDVDLDGPDPLPVGYVSAPVYEATGAVGLILGVLVGSRDAKGSDLRAYGELLADCGRAITEEVRALEAPPGPGTGR